VTDTILKVKNITKRFPGVIALDHINLEINKGEVHAIIGENGAGKSTLCKILTGNYIADEGEIDFLGKKVSFQRPSEALDAGISMVYQERNLISSFTGAQNICLGNEPGSGVLVKENDILEVSNKLKDMLGIDVPLDVPVGRLGAGIQQIIEIIRCFYHEPKLLILDEPTSSLGAEEVSSFLRFIKKIVKDTEVSVIFISHKLDEVFEVSDRISVFTEGKLIMTRETSQTTQEACIAAMLKTDVLDEVEVHQADIQNKPVILRAGKCTYDNAEHELNFCVHAGEAVGFYGLVGAGRTECVQAIFGMRAMTDYDIELNGKRPEKITPCEMIKNGLILVPEKRADAIFSSYSLVENISLLFLENVSSKMCGVINQTKEENLGEKILSKNNVKYSDRHQAISELSGGNIQKIIIGRSQEIDNISCLILDEPTNGLDIGAKNEVYMRIRDLVENKDTSVIFISSEIEELIKVCDRIYVFGWGSVTAEFKRDDFVKENILKAAFRRRA